MRHVVKHEPEWVPAVLPYNAAGDTRPGWRCAHVLENGNGTCQGNVWRIEDAIGMHSCVVDTAENLEPDEYACHICGRELVAPWQQCPECGA